ncbi:MAG: MAPEG family protein [Marinovum sp.]|nr:MAPEG family protein [Marinovum sp.]
MFAITSIYAAFLALLFIALSFRVIAYRRSNKISLGDEGNKSLMKRMRAHANCAEYVPMGLIVLALVEAQEAPSVAVHALGLLLLIGRVMHGYGFSASPPIMFLRVWGMILTFTMLALAAIALLILAAF